MTDFSQPVYTRPTDRQGRPSGRWFRNARMQNKLILVFVLLSFIPLLISGIVSTRASSEAVREKIGIYSLELVSQVSTNIETNLQKIRTYSDDMITAADISNRFYGYKLAAPIDQSAIRSYYFLKLQLSFINMDHVDDAMFIFNRNDEGTLYHLSNVSTHYRWSPAEIERIVAANLEPDNTRNLTLTVTDLGGTNGDNIVVGRKIINASTHEVLGHLLIALSPDYFNSLYQDLQIGDGSQVLVINSDGMVVSSLSPAYQPGEAFPDNRLIESIRQGNAKRNSFNLSLDGQRQLISYARIGTSGLYAVLAVPSAYLDAESSKLSGQMFILSLGILLLSVMIAVLLSRSIAKPLVRLADNMTRFGSGAKFQQPDADRDDEVGHLEQSFNQMTDSIRTLVARIEEENKVRRLSELRVLEYQVNPHFLYNSLDSINWLAQKASQPEIGAMVTALARFYRLGLSKGRETYRIRDEIDHVRNYLILSQLRDKESFSFEIDVDPGILEYKTLRIILQPLAENAIKYGVRKLGHDGRLTIVGRQDQDTIVFEVSDNGPGIEPAQLKHINESLAAMQELSSEDHGFGLLNVHQRIQLNYSGRYGVSLDSSAETGTTARIIIPLLP